jgi:hypothetical protein
MIKKITVEIETIKLVLKVHLVHRVQKVTLEQLVHRVKKVTLEQLEQLVLKEFKV